MKWISEFTLARKTLGCFVLAIALVGALAAPSFAQFGVVPVELEVPFFGGVAVGALPDYEGSNDYTFGVAPFLRYTFSGTERYIQLLANELTVNVVDHRNFRFGPLAMYKFGRDDNVDDDRVKRMQEIDDTVMLGGFFDYVHRFQNPRQRWITGVDFKADVGGENDGWLLGVSTRFWQPVSKEVDLMFGARLNVVDNDYNNTYFGVNRANVGQSGLPFFEADGGAKDVALTAAAIFYLSPNWLLTGGVRYSRLVGDAADSPIVDQRGSENQFIAGIGIGYMWGVKEKR
jgi:MipA family protein